MCRRLVFAAHGSGPCDAGFLIDVSKMIGVAQLKDSNLPVLDVREITQYEDDGRIPCAVNACVGHIQDHVFDLLAEFPKAEPVVVTCSVGHRGRPDHEHLESKWIRARSLIFSAEWMLGTSKSYHEERPQ
jgi:rhodanese-related sulfurtransferase